MVNGYAIAVTAGRIQKGAKEVFVRSKYFPGNDGVVASTRTIEAFLRDNMLTAISRRDRELVESRAAAIAGHPGAGKEFSGNGRVFSVTYRRDEQRTYEQKRGA